MFYKKTPRNRPIATLIRWYSDKKGGKVTEARREIEKRFDFLDWKDQKRIILAFLQSGKTDRQWAYGKIYRQWDESYQQPVRELWEEYHENMCAWSVIQHFPIDYVREQAERLEEVNQYYHLCMRLTEQPDYPIDMSKLTGRQYLTVMLNARRPVSADDAECIFFRTLYQNCLANPRHLRNVVTKKRGRTFSAFDINFIYSFIPLFRQLDLDDLVEKLYIWDEEVREQMEQGGELKALDKACIDDEEYHYRRMAIGLDYIGRAIDDRYKTDKSPLPLRKDPIMTMSEWLLPYPTSDEALAPAVTPAESLATVETAAFENAPNAPEMIEDMKARRPAVEALVNKLGLEIL